MKSLQQKAKQILKDHNVQVLRTFTDKTGKVNYRIKLSCRNANPKALKALKQLEEIEGVIKVGIIEEINYYSKGYTIHTRVKPSLI